LTQKKGEERRREKREREREKLYYHLATIKVVITSGKNHQWI
jgi:hypothetical protein